MKRPVACQASVTSRVIKPLAIGATIRAPGAACASHGVGTRDSAQVVPMPRPGLSVAQRRVGLELRRLRTEAGAVRAARRRLRCRRCTRRPHPGGKVKAWWEPYRDLLIGNYIPFETAATEVNEFQLEVAPGLLQIAPYIGAMMRAARLGAPEDEIERHVQLRLDRQAVLRPPGRTRTHLPRPEP